MPLNPCTNTTNNVEVGLGITAKDSSASGSEALMMVVILVLVTF